MLAVGDKVFKDGVLKFLKERRMTRQITPAAAMFNGARRQHARRRRLWRGRAAGAAAARRWPDPPCLARTTGDRSRGWAGPPTRSTSAAMAIPNGSPNGAYAFSDFAADARALARTLAERSGKRPAAVGASLGGIASLMAEGVAAKARRPAAVSALVLVDITPRVDMRASPRCRASCARMPNEGFARSRRPPTRSRPICRTGRGRVPTRG